VAAVAAGAATSTAEGGLRAALFTRKG
jgi:hypothetical protein